MTDCVAECNCMTSQGRSEVMRSCLWVTVTIKGGRQTTVGSYVETIGDDVFMDDVSLFHPGDIV